VAPALAEELKPTTSAPHATAAAPQKLAAGWSAHFDREYKRWYFSAAGQETRWDSCASVAGWSVSWSAEFSDWFYTEAATGAQLWERQGAPPDPDADPETAAAERKAAAARPREEPEAAPAEERPSSADDAAPAPTDALGAALAEQAKRLKKAEVVEHTAADWEQRDSTSEMKSNALFERQKAEIAAAEAKAVAERAEAAEEQIAYDADALAFTVVQRTQREDFQAAYDEAIFQRLHAGQSKAEVERAIAAGEFDAEA